MPIKYHLEYYQWPSKISLQFRLNSMKLENYFIVKDEIRHGKLFIACLKEPYCDPLFDHKVVAVERLLSPWHSHTILFQRITIPNKNSCQVRWNWRSLLLLYIWASLELFLEHLQICCCLRKMLEMISLCIPKNYDITAFIFLGII